MKNIVILGAGFAGLKTAIKLEKSLKKSFGNAPSSAKASAGRQDKLHHEWSVILIDRNSFHTYTSSLYEVASAYSRKYAEDFEELLGSSSCLSLVDIIGRKKITFIKQEVAGIDFIKKLVTTNTGDAIPFEYLVLALGSETSHFGVPGAEQCCFSLKTLQDALNIRKRIKEIFVQHKARGLNGKIKIIMAGAGPTGVETIAEIAKYAGHLARDYKIDRSGVNILLLEARDEILPYAAPAQRTAIEKRLKNLGIEIIAGARINEVMQTCVVLEGGAKCEADIILWGGGTKGPAILKTFKGIELDNRGRALVNEFLSPYVGSPEGGQISKYVFAIGDNAVFVDKKSGMPAPATAYIAEQQADTAAKNIIRSIQKLPLKEYKPAIPGYIISCGGKYAVVNIYGVTFSGFFGWELKRLIDLKYFISILPFYKALSLWFKEMNLFTKND